MDWLAVEVWYERTISETELETAGDILTEIFSRYGSLGVEIKTKINVVIGHIPATLDCETRLESLKSDLQNLFETSEGLPMPNAVRVKRYTEKEWNQTIYGSLKPKRIGKRLYLIPEWIKTETTPDDIIILISRCQAFGTGEHPTTEMCLEFVEELVKPGMTLLDVGTGSGVLSIAAAKLGAVKCLAGDNDPIAVESAQANAEVNGVEKKIEVHEASGFDIPGVDMLDTDIAISNILSTIVIELAPKASTVLKPGAIWVVSGITRGTWLKVEEALKANRFEVIELKESGDWVAASARRK